MFSTCDEKTLDKIYDLITHTYYSPDPVWEERDNGPERHHCRLYAVHALNDMRALYACVGNNGWWEEERVLHLEDLRDIIPYSMEQVLWQNEQMRAYYEKLDTIREESDCCREFICRNLNVPEIVKMQGNKDGKLYEYTKELFWDSVEWFLKNYATDEEMSKFKAHINS